MVATEDECLETVLMPGFIFRILNKRRDKRDPPRQVVRLVDTSGFINLSFYQQQARVRKILDRAVPDCFEYGELAALLMVRSGKPISSGLAASFAHRIEAIHRGTITDPSVDELELIMSVFGGAPNLCINDDAMCKKVLSSIDLMRAVKALPYSSGARNIPTGDGPSASLGGGSGKPPA